MSKTGQITNKLIPIGAVIITYLPKLGDLKKLLESLYAQEEINHIVIVDNSANEEVFKSIYNLTLQNKKKEIKILPQKNNLGIASALNIGIKYLENYNLKWVLTMDQDSILPKNAIKYVLEYKNKFYNKDNSIVSISLYKDKLNKNETEFVNMAITSGNLVKLNVFKEVGYFDDNLFIDAVDVDFSFKLRLAGYKILRFNHINFEHKLGELVHKKIFGKTILYSQHSAIREYYITRNNLIILSRYWKFFPLEIFIIFKQLIKDYIKLIWFGKEKIKKNKAILLGIWHFLIKKREANNKILD